MAQKEIKELEELEMIMCGEAPAPKYEGKEEPPKKIQKKGEEPETYQ